MKNLLLLKGGGGHEHEVSLKTADYLKSLIDRELFNVVEVEVDKGFTWSAGGNGVQLNFDRELVFEDGKKVAVDLCVPCFHGYPGETGHIQAYFEMIGMPFLGCGHEASAVCFNKVLTKLWMEKAGVPVTDFIILNDAGSDSLKRLESFYELHGSVFIKASNQGSSVGCFPVESKAGLGPKLKEAFHYSNFVLAEKKLAPRELEISVFEFGGELKATDPCEIICPDKFYSYEEKYSETSQTKTALRADLPPQTAGRIKERAKRAFRNLKLSQFCRMDFFLENDDIYLNEINTFPGMTSISMFPKMIEASGYSYREVLNEHLSALIS